MLIVKKAMEGYQETNTVRFMPVDLTHVDLGGWVMWLGQYAYIALTPSYNWEYYGFSL